VSIGVKVDGEYQQLNSNLLQIENEYYSTVRPKQIIQPCEKPTLALKRRGVHYVEIRSLDLDLFNPIGIDADRARFIEALLLSCWGKTTVLQRAFHVEFALKGLDQDCRPVYAALAVLDYKSCQFHLCPKYRKWVVPDQVSHWPSTLYRSPVTELFSTAKSGNSCRRFYDSQC
jgi:hypothetical protein